ncbi:MAG: TolC family protein [Fimbriimonas sp.]|nr:TolC family protein [Fimbriimonas sp.]
MKGFGLLGTIVLAASSWAGESLTLEEALKLAKTNNGTLKAAASDIKAATARKAQATSALFPSLTPAFSFSKTKNEQGNSTIGGTTFEFEQTATQARINWRILDSGERLTQIRSAREGEAAQVAQSRQTYRQVIFGVHQQYIETLRAQELESLADYQFKRAETVLEQTKARVNVGDAARREILQAQADTLNASVNVITAKNRVDTNAATLKSQIGLQKDFERPVLSPYKVEIDSPAELSKAVEVGMTIRPDLIARRRNIGSTQQSLRSAQIGASLQWSLDYTDTTFFTPTNGNNQNISFLLSYPLFDGGNARSGVAIQRANLESATATLTQAERDARSEIESAFITFSQNKSRAEAAEKALEAAKLNFEATTESRRLGASDLIEVLTAQVSLATAESNRIDAKYDLLISQLRLQLATGMPIPGEDN